MLGDISVYYSPSEQVSKQTDELASSLGFNFIFSNLLLTSRTSDWEKQIAQFVISARLRDNTIPLVTVKKSCLALLSKSSSETQPCLRVFTRVTVVLQHGDKLDTLIESLFTKIANHTEVDCFCIRPAHEVQFLELINNRSKYMYDLISIDVSNGNFFQQIGTVVKTLKSSNNLFIELELSQTQRGTTELINLVSQTKLIFPRTNVAVISSGAKSPFELRSPLDLLNWGQNIMCIRGCDKRVDQLLQNIAKKRFMRSNFLPLK